MTLPPSKIDQHSQYVNATYDICFPFFCLGPCAIRSFGNFSHVLWMNDSTRLPVGPRSAADPPWVSWAESKGPDFTRSQLPISSVCPLKSVFSFSRTMRPIKNPKTISHLSGVLVKYLRKLKDTLFTKEAGQVSSSFPPTGSQAETLWHFWRWDSRNAASAKRDFEI